MSLVSDLISLADEETKKNLSNIAITFDIARETEEILAPLALREHQMDKVAQMIKKPEDYLKVKKALLQTINKNASEKYAKKVSEFQKAGIPLPLAKNLAKPLVKSWIDGELTKIEFQYPESVGNAGIDLKLAGPNANLKALESAKIE